MYRTNTSSALAAGGRAFPKQVAADESSHRLFDTWVRWVGQNREESAIEGTEEGSRQVAAREKELMRHVPPSPLTQRLSSVCVYSCASLWLRTTNFVAMQRKAMFEPNGIISVIGAPCQTLHQGTHRWVQCHGMPPFCYCIPIAIVASGRP